RAMTFSRLIQAGELEHVAELQWRIGIPLATIILGILAVPLSKTQPRAGRYGRLAIGLLVFIIYLNMLSAAKVWVEQGSLSPLLGLWWVHGAVLSIALGILAVQNSVHKRLFR
ncbi:MAG: LptF/LptG family permease, partial [Gammaproteobacteria bacterium]|nr:LptF/LptG family permease [Gammaproteobacteria bacterium]